LIQHKESGRPNQTTPIIQLKFLAEVGITKTLKI
jgi:hypothetical protein